MTYISTNALTQSGGRLACENLGVRKLYMRVEDYRRVKTEVREGEVHEEETAAGGRDP